MKDIIAKRKYFAESMNLTRPRKINLEQFNSVDHASLDPHIKLVSRYYLGTLASVILISLAIYATMQVVLERHSAQQSISFLTSNQFIKFQQLANTARALMRASADNVVSTEVLDRLNDDMRQKIKEIRDTSAQLRLLHLQLNEDATPSELEQRLQSFLERAEILGKVDNVSRGRRYAFWGPIDFAAASDSIIMRGFQDEIKQSFARSEASIHTAKRISALLIMSLVVALLVVGVLILAPLLKKLGIEHEKKKKYEQQLAILALKDGLTDLPNRLSFNQMLDGLIALGASDDGSPVHRGFALLLIDLDHFKAINDTFGHQTGDGLLIAVAQRITSPDNSEVVAARLGGDEFAILLPDVTDEDGIEKFAAVIRENLSLPFTIEGHTFSISGSIGGAFFPAHGACAQDLIRCADLALYAAKIQRNTLVIFNDQLMAGRLAESQLRAAVFNALENGELLVYYQSKIDIRSGRHVGFEALVRWRHPDLGILPPGRFLHLLDTASSITSMTEFVVNQVARDIRSWRNAGLSPGTVAINMPEAILISDAGYDMLANAVKRYSLDWRDFAIEITEDVFVNKYMGQILATVAKLREQSVSIDLDDFGTGFASLTNLRNFPFDDIKIDRSFVADIGINPKSEQIIKAMIDLVGNLGKNCIAEGVETQEQLLFLQNSGCVIAQGYLFDQPQPFSVAARMLESEGSAHSASVQCVRQSGSLMAF